MQGRVYSLNIGKVKGGSKTPIRQARLIRSFGMEGDAHAAKGERQVSLLDFECIRQQKECPKAKKSKLTFGPGDFSENITTEGLSLVGLKIGDRLKIGAKILLEISKIGKECHRYCSIYSKVGDCIMPREGIFAKVLKGGRISIEDDIGVVKMKGHNNPEIKKVE